MKWYCIISYILVQFYNIITIWLSPCIWSLIISCCRVLSLNATNTRLNIYILQNYTIFILFYLQRRCIFFQSWLITMFLQLHHLNIFFLILILIDKRTCFTISFLIFFLNHRKLSVDNCVSWLITPKHHKDNF